MSNDPTAGSKLTQPPIATERLQDAQRDRLLLAFDELSSPQQIGPYRIITSIGHGGMGEVYKAQQQEPINRVVAIKVIKLGMDTKEVIARFEGERQALAMMDHPCIAKVFDAGATEAGRPYFVMEYVPGEPITEYCDKHQLTLKQRLELFVQVCDAVQHAHQKGIIHRDLKPSNILISVRDQHLVPKVIDFGVAKATSQHLAEQTVFTRQGQLIGTPEYMSPEQAEMSALDIDTRSDVYSLGVVLYELLAGALPFEPQTLRRAALGEIQRIIREADPPRPSTRLSSLDADRASRVAQQRQSAFDDLRRELRNELEWIPLKAMRKDRTQRYRAASELADDMNNYLNDRPLIAGPESSAYRLRKFLRRNRLGVAVSTAILMLLVAGITTTSWEAVRATRAEGRALQNQNRAQDQQQRAESAMRRAQSERDGAQATLQFLSHDVLAKASPEFIPDLKVRDTIVKAMIVPAADHVGESFKDRPQVEASVREAIVEALTRLGRYDLVLPHAQRVLSLRRQTGGDADAETIAAQVNYGEVLRNLGRLSEAESLLKEAMERARGAIGADRELIYQSLTAYASAVMQQGRPAEAEPLLAQCLTETRRLVGADHPDAIEALCNYAAVLVNLERLTEAEPLFKEALERNRHVFGEDHPGTILALHNYADVLERLGRMAEAEPLRREAVERARRVLGEDHPTTLDALRGYGYVLFQQGRPAEALEQLERCFQGRRKTLGEDQPGTLRSLSDCASMLMMLGRKAEAEPRYREVLARAVANPNLGLRHPDTQTYALLHYRCLDALGRHEEAAEIRTKFNLPAPTSSPASAPAYAPATQPQ